MYFEIAPDNPGRVNDLISMAACWPSGCYLSTPITGGKRLLSWDGNPESKYAQVTLPNIEGARALSRTISGGCIDPTFLHIDGFTQNDYRYLWGQVITKHANRLVMADGWEYSVGCVYEYLCAERVYIWALDSNNQWIQNYRASKMIGDAIKELNLAGKPCLELEELLKDVETLSGN